MTGETENTFGAWLRAQRKLARMTQQDVADKAGVHVTTVSKLENDDRGVTADVVIALAAALGVSHDVALSRAGVELEGRLLDDDDAAYAEAKALLASIDDPDDRDRAIVILRAYAQSCKESRARGPRAAPARPRLT